MSVATAADDQPMLLVHPEPDPTRHGCDYQHKGDKAATWYVECPVPGRYLPLVRWACDFHLLKACAGLMQDLRRRRG